MLRRFGSLIWRQSRDISVLNYPNHVVYEIYTNQGYFYVAQDKITDKIEVVNGLAERSPSIDFSKYKTNKDKTIFLPSLQ